MRLYTTVPAHISERFQDTLSVSVTKERLPQGPLHQFRCICPENRSYKVQPIITFVKKKKKSRFLENSRSMFYYLKSTCPAAVVQGNNVYF